jgi:DNA-binding transcriptional ArsR family regulator
MQAGGDEQERRISERLAVMADPLRLAVVDCLVLEPATAGELADELGVPVEQIRYQIKRLRRAGIVLVHDKRWRRGAVEYVYIADSRQLVFPQESAPSSANQRRRYIPRSLRSIFKEALEATQAGAFRETDDCVVVRIPVRVDRTGFQEIREIIEAAAGDILEAGEKSKIRLQRAAGKPKAATSVLLFFETPS